jgi:hypothetical protein
MAMQYLPGGVAEGLLVGRLRLVLDFAVDGLGLHRVAQRQQPEERVHLKDRGES